ncbi:MAG: hypothetical protein MZV63_67080 [Marinilabiliales bacterium]|nr:hypothetical protein [Marinilabiliales bacterium]
MSIICMRAASSSSLRRASCAEALSEEPLVLDGNHYDARDSLDEVEVFYQRAHPFSLLVNIAYKHECRRDIVIQDRNDNIDRFKRLLGNFGAVSP